MIGQMVSAYQKLQMDMIGKLSIDNEDIINEVPYFDEGYISVQVERLKKKHDDLSRELKLSVELNAQSDYEKEKRKKLQASLQKIEVKIIYYALNSLQSLPVCEALADGKDYKVRSLIKGLRAFENDDKPAAFRHFHQYFSENDIESAYYLANKIYGDLLLKSGSPREALRHLEYAVQLKVDDVELLLSLKRAYQETAMQSECRTVEEVLHILEQGLLK